MCRSLMVLCLAPTRESLRELKLAAVATAWEVAGATSLQDLPAGTVADFVVVGSGMDPGVVEAARRLFPSARIIVVGGGRAADGSPPTLRDVRDAILGMPPPGGPVRR